MKQFITLSTFLAISTISLAQMGLGTTNPAVKLHIKSNAAMLRLEGTDHALMEFYPICTISIHQVCLSLEQIILKECRSLLMEKWE